MVAHQYSLQFELLAHDSMRFVSMYLADDGRAIRKSNSRNALAIPPTSWAMGLLEAFEVTDLLADGDGLDIGDLAEDLDSQLSPLRMNHES